VPVSIRRAAAADYPALESIEDAADQLLIDRLNADRWEPAPSGLSRAAAPGFVLVAEETETATVIGFVHVVETAEIAHVEQLSVLPRMGQRGYELITLRTYADVPWNAPFYARAGFVETPPTTDFHRDLIQVEERLGLARFGRRVQMTAALR
jgi:hypothetical protein